MKKKLFFAAIALTTLAGCTDESYVGDQSLLTNETGAISFNMKTPAITRADKEGSEAATLLNKNFVFFGYKTMPSGTTSPQIVFPNYQANYVANTANKTTSNSADWEYVGYKRLTDNMSDHKGVAYNATNATNAADADQTIKYWDYSATSYKFYAYSLGAGNSDTYANASLMSTSDTYTLSGNQDQLSTCYISELKTINDPNGSTPQEVDLRFLSIKSKIQLGFYETIPGYSVKELKFYDSSSDTELDDTPILFAGSSTLPKSGTYTITFDSNGKPQLGWAAAESDGTQAFVSFSSTLTNYAERDYRETAAENTYLGRASNAATRTEEKDILPYANGADLTLKVDYTLVSRDGSLETIKVKGATAKIPAAFTKWKPNYKYTYLFKISDNTDGDVGEVTGLHPITLDAVVASEQDGSQETITTVSEPSITSYAKASAVLTDNEYLTGNTIYIVVEDNGTNVALSSTSSANLYTVTIQDGAAQGISENTVENAIKNGSYNSTDKTWTVTDALGKNMVVTLATSLISTDTKIPDTDSPTGVDLNVNIAKFTPAAPTFNAVTSGTVIKSGETYYTAADGKTKVTLDADGTASENQYWTKSSNEGYYVFEYIKDSTHKYYKVIKVVDKY